ncbi:GNAT family N-acetyltransferase [soil metagenome]
MSPRLIPVAHSDNSLLFEIYVSSRAEELKLAPWTEDQKLAFLESQFEAQTNHYYSSYPNGSFDLIKLEDQTAGRLFQAELDDEIRIIDITLLPQFRSCGIGTLLLSNILETGKNKQKPVRIYLETYNRSQTLFTRLGFIPVADDGVYCLWEKTPEEKNRTSEGLAVSVVNKTG